MAEPRSPAELADWSMAVYLAGREPEVLAAIYDQRRADFSLVIASAERFGPRALHHDIETLAPTVGITNPLAGTLLDGANGDLHRRQEQAAWEVARGYAAAKAFSPEGYEPDVPMEPDESDLEVLAQMLAAEAAQAQKSKSGAGVGVRKSPVIDSSTVALAGVGLLLGYMATGGK